MRRVTIVAVLVAVLLALPAGVALAETFYGTDGRDTITGTNGSDRIFGKRGDDNLFGKGGKDRVEGNRGDDDVYGGDGRDELFGGRGNDYIVAQGDGKSDFVDCGSERDVVVATPQDRVKANCEVIK